MVPRSAARRRRRRVWRGRRAWALLAILSAVAVVFMFRPQFGLTGQSSPAPAAAVSPPVRNPLTDPNAALTDLSLLPSLWSGVLVGQTSSVDPAGLNNDGSPNNILYKTPAGASVIFDASGPGVVDDIWVAGSLSAMGNIVITLDGAATPQVDMPAAKFFSGTTAPFLAPLVGDATVSSGGDYAQVPIAFQRSCVIAFTGTTAYWDVGFRRLPGGTHVQPFSPGESLAAAAALWAHAGQNPWAGEQTREAAGWVNLAPGATVTLARLRGPAELDALQLTVPSAAVVPGRTITADGIAFTGTSQFTMRLNPHNTGATLVRRVDDAVTNQTATVAVDGVPVGTFSTPGGTSGPYFWRNASVPIPASLTAGRTSVTVTIQAQAPFTTFGYWMTDQVDGKRVTTDALPLTPAAEQAHAFSVGQLVWQRQMTSRYVPPGLAQSASVLSHLRLRISFDGSATPQVDAPVGLFFFAGAGAASVRALLDAVDPTTGTLSSYWPMPFAHRATVTLTNAGPTPINAVRYAISSRRNAQVSTALASGAAGYFHATYQHAAPTPASGEYTVLAAPGTGKLVGVSMALSTPPGMPYGLENLQGNADLTVNGDPQPAYRGTGTEDFFEGGWYFENGPFTLPTHGSPAQWIGPNDADRIAAYRIFIADAVPFNAGARLTLQVGPTGNLRADYRSVAFWYGEPRPTLTVADALQLADGAQAAAHDLTLTAAAAPPAKTSAASSTPASSTSVGSTPAGSTTTGSPPPVPTVPGAVTFQAAAFTVHVPPDNQGVELRAQIDACPGHTAVTVSVNGTALGVWQYPGQNCAVPQATTRFLVPAAVSQGASTLRIRLTALAGPGATPGAPATWTASAFDVLAWLPPQAAYAAP